MFNMFRMLVHPSSGACDLFVQLFHGLYCSGSMRVGVTVWFGWGGVVSVCRLKPEGWSLHTDTTPRMPPQPNHSATPTHIEPEQYNPWNNWTNKSQVPEDGCINIRNMLSVNNEIIKQVTSSFSLFIQLSRWCTSNKHNVLVYLSALQAINNLLPLFFWTRYFIAVIKRVCIWSALRYMASVHSIAQYFCDSLFNIIIPSTSTCAKCFIHFGFSDSSFVWTSKCLNSFNFIAPVVALNSRSYKVTNVAVFATLLTSNFLRPLYTSHKYFPSMLVPKGNASRTSFSSLSPWTSCCSLRKSTKIWFSEPSFEIELLLPGGTCHVIIGLQ